MRTRDEISQNHRVQSRDDHKLEKGYHSIMGEDCEGMECEKNQWGTDHSNINAGNKTNIFEMLNGAALAASAL
jgi:hypothetical protein